MSRGGRRRSSMAQEGNPLKDDASLRNQLIQLDRVKTKSKFDPWKRSFMKRFESFLDQSGVEKAQEAYEEFSRDMNRTVSLVNKCEEMNRKGDLTNERATVRGRQALNEMVSDLVVRWAAIKEMVPGTGNEEEKRGYNKFMLGAILVRDDFSEYEHMQYVNDAIQVMTEESLTEVADRVHLEQFGNFQMQFKRFCDLLADLGLYEVMMACRKFTDFEGEEEESLTEEETICSEEAESIILVDMKTSSIFQMNVDVAIEKGIISLAPRVDDATDFQDRYIMQTCDSREKKEEIKSKLNNHPSLGLATHLVVRKSTVMENEYTELEEKEAVTNMWGIKLKSTNKKIKKNEELFFFDQYTGAVGELNRQAAINSGCIHEERNENNIIMLREAEEENSQWESLRAKIRGIIGIQMEEERDDISPLVYMGRESIAIRL